MSKVSAVILAGGVGSRLWPLSRSLAPKQLQKIGSEGTLLQDTIVRADNSLKLNGMVFVTSSNFVHEVKRQAVQCLGPKAEGYTYVGEPFGRNTAPAILLAALILSKKNPDAQMFVMPSDHIIRDQNAFFHAVEKSLHAAEDGYLVTYGILPTRADTGYGYIKADEALGDVYKVHSFKEKPSSVVAQQYFENGSYFWNSGIFLFSASALLSEGKKYLPDMVAELEKMDLSGFANFDSVYEKIEPVSIDYGIMEKTGKAAVVPVSMGWSDVGSWDSLYDISEKDDSSNVITGDVIKLNSRNNLVLSEGDRVVCLAGVKDMILVDTSDALLICPRQQSQSVREVVGALEGLDRVEASHHKAVQRPWGSYTVLLEGEGFKVKRITVTSGEKLSLQFHHHRSENWIVVKGKGLVTRDEEESILEVGEGIKIPKLTRHRLENPGKETLEIIEVQEGDYLGEDDIVRLEDKYDRQNNV